MRETAAGDLLDRRDPWLRAGDDGAVRLRSRPDPVEETRAPAHASHRGTNARQRGVRDARPCDAFNRRRFLGKQRRARRPASEKGLSKACRGEKRQAQDGSRHTCNALPGRRASAAVRRLVMPESTRAGRKPQAARRPRRFAPRNAACVPGRCRKACRTAGRLLTSMTRERRWLRSPTIRQQRRGRLSPGLQGKRKG